MGSARARTRAGTTRKPPPTPRNPVSSPTTVAVTTTLRARGHWHMKVGLNVMIGSSSRGRSTGAAWSPRDRRRVRSWRTVIRPRDHQHQRREGGQEHRLGDRGRQVRPRDGAADGDRAERDPAGEQHVAGPSGGDGPREGGDPDDDERPGGRLRGGLTEREEHGDGQDGAAAAERTQAEPDERAGDDGEEELDHASGPTRWRPTCSALSKESSIATSERPAASSIEAATDAR